jgi:hypothetical protein
VVCASYILARFGGGEELKLLQNKHDRIEPPTKRQDAKYYGTILYIYKVTKKGKQINEQYTDKKNPIFETILKIYPND